MKSNFKPIPLVSLLIVSLLISASAFSATSGNITISGSVPASTGIVVSGVGTYNALDLTTNASDLQVASVREINNTANGYSVTMSSQNSGALKNGSLGSVAYTAKYNGTAATLSSTPVTVTNSGSATTVVNVLKSLTVSYTGQPSGNLMAGTYSDTLTFTIAAH